MNVPHRLYFAHQFQDGRMMTITCVRESSKLPKLICRPKFCGAEDEQTLTEYAIWRNYIFDVLLEMLDEGEILAIAQKGMKK